MTKTTQLRFWSIFFGIIAALAIISSVYFAVDNKAYSSGENTSQIEGQQRTVADTDPDSGNRWDTVDPDPEQLAYDYTNQYKHNLENVYAQNLYSLTDGMSNLSSSLDKLSVANGKQTVFSLLTDCNGYAYACAANLALLPLDNGDELTQSALRYVNQVADYCDCIAEKIAFGGGLTQSERSQLSDFCDIAQQFHRTLNEVAQNNDYYLQSVTSPTEQDTSETKTMFDYPALIYDGPFSDADKKGIKTGESITHQEGAQLVERLMNAYGVESVDYQGEVNSNGVTALSYKVNCHQADSYNFLLTTDGKVLQFNGYGASSPDNTDSDYSSIAEEFASLVGYNVSAVWASEPVAGVVYVNLIHVDEEGIKYYPDMIKVAIDEETRQVTALDAYAYLSNHTDRKLPKHFDRYAIAQSKLYGKLTPTQRGRAIIPDDCGKEYVCYEFIVNSGDDVYYVYIDADNFIERNILKVVESSYGQYVM